MVLQLLRGRLAALARKYRVPGAQLAVHQAGETVTVEVGQLEHRGERRVTRESAFPVGSISKSFTATAAMVLVADADLDLDSPVDEVLPELAGSTAQRDLRWPADWAAEVTLRQLLSHTAGLASGPASEDVAEVSAKRYLMEHCRRHNLVAPPGAGFSYSNLGYVVVGRMVEAVTGMSWPEAIESIVLRPLGIAPAFVTGGDATRPVAVGHSVNLDAGRTRPVSQSLAPAEAAAGGLAVSAADLVCLGAVHLEPGVPDLLPADFAEQMRKPVPEADPCGLADGWGLGLAVFGGALTDWVGHDGNAHGTSCYLRVAPASGCAVALTSNSNTGSGMWAELLAELAHAGLPLPAVPRDGQYEPTVVPAPPECAGRYLNGDVEYLVAVRQGHLCLSVDGGPFARLTCRDDLTFSSRDPVSGRQVLGGRFRRDPATGDVNAILVGGRLARRLARHTRRTDQQLTA
jgi:CubicO group peptidase (beta-lactamase class C family)